MVYDWDAHQKTCYQLYIDEDRSLEDIMDHMKVVYKFTPSKRAFQTQFRRWNFPSKHRPAYKNDRLVNRIRELWERNLPQREILRVLNDEDGFHINSRELMRVRTRNRWLLRVPNGDKSILDADSPIKDSSLEVSDLKDGDLTLSLPEDQSLSLQPLSDAVAAAVLDELNHENPNPAPDKNEKKKAKRNRQPTNAAGVPTRFPSETTIDEARVILSLDDSVYREIRSSFQRICIEEGVSKKTLAGTHGWDAVKDRLIRDCPRLQQALWGPKDNDDAKKLALDIICTDVTKRMRDTETRMTLAEAKNTLGVNPEESREIRFTFHQVLRDAQFTYKSDATPQEWEELKQRWVEKSSLIKNLTMSTADGTSQVRAKALEILARDVMKRMRDDRVRKSSKKRGPAACQTRPEPQPHDLQGQQQQQQEQSPSPATQLEGDEASATPPVAAYQVHSRGESSPSQLVDSPQTGQVDLGDGIGNGNFDTISEVSHASQMQFAPSEGAMATHLSLSIPSQSSSLSGSPSGLPQPHRVLGSSIPTGVPLDAQIGSSLFLAANTQAAFMDQQYVQQQYAAAAAPNPVFHAVQPFSTAIAVFLRLHPSSTFVANVGLWIATLTSQSIQELRHVATEKFPGALCLRVEGIVKDGKGGELPLQIQEDQELGAYLVHVQGSTPTFAVQLVWKT